MTNDEIEATLRTLIAETLACEEDEVVPDARFAADLGGTSLDYLDLGFRCTRAFGVEVRFNELAPDAMAVDNEGRLTPDSAEIVRERFPFIELPSHGTLPHVDDLMTVRAITRHIGFLIANGGS